MSSCSALGIGINLVIAPWISTQTIGLWGLPVVLLISFFLLGVESVDSEIEEPFGTGVDDLKLERFCETIRLSVEEILGSFMENGLRGAPTGDMPKIE